MVVLLLLACTGASDGPGAPSVDPPDSAATDTAADSGDSAEDPSVDDDGDGFYAGEDCDDEDPTRYPVAPDDCDGVDQDCDGNPVGEGACGELIVVDESSAIGWWEAGAETSGLTLLRNATGTWGRPTDFDGDGILDVVADHGGPLLLHGRLPWPNTLVTGVDWLGSWGGDFNIAGDFDGDGWPDVFGTYSEDGHEELYEGAVYLHLGPPSRWPTVRESMRVGADAHWTHEDGKESFGEAQEAADLTGDGLSDLVLLGGKSSNLSGPNDPGGYVRILPGRTSGLPMGIPIEEEEPWFTVDFEVYATSNQMVIVPDIDGDGIPELSLLAPGWHEDGDLADTLAIVPTAVITPEFTGQEITELWELIPLGDSLQRIELVRDNNVLGDANGDGYGDVALTTYDTMDVAGEVICLGALHGGATVSASTVSDQLGGRVCYQRNYPDRVNGVPGHQRVVPDTDRDGVADLFWSSVTSVPGDYYADRMSCVIPTAQLPTAGKALVEDVRKFCFGSGTDEEFHQTDVADLDGDGLPELLAVEGTYEGEYGIGRILVVPGFEIPWGDSTRW